jgi:HAD superfamily hydrolase (TIGR01459 family)
MSEVSVNDLLSRYDVFLLDAYGVIVSTAGALPGAAELLERIRGAGKQFVVLTNDASRLPETIVRRFVGFGLEVELARIVTSGMLLAPHFAECGLTGARSIVMGPDDSVRYVEQAGGKPVSTSEEDVSVVVVCDDDGYDVRQGLDEVITVLFRRFDRGLNTALVLPNPDLLYLRGPRAYGITSGSIALVIEAALDLRFPGRGYRFERLGKPHRPMYEAALRVCGSTDRRRAVMLGDQLATDILGANQFGIDSVLVGSGLNRVEEASTGARPTYTMSDLRALQE